MSELLNAATYEPVGEGFRRVRVPVETTPTTAHREEIFDALHDRHSSVVPQPQVAGFVEALVMG